LEDAHGIVGAEDRDRRTEVDALRAARDRREHGLGGGDREVGAVVLTETDHVDPHVLGQHGLLDHVADDVGLVPQATVGAGGDVTEGVEAEFEGGVHGSLRSSLRRS